MAMYFKEANTPHTAFELGIKNILHREISPVQTIEVLDSYDFGRVLVIDGSIMLTQRDEFIYHEMLVHVPLAVHPGVEKVLVIGGGDGGILHQLLRYPEIQQIDLVEIDERVVRICEEFFPELASSFQNPKVQLHVADGLKFIRKPKDYYDLIIVDSTDPIGPGQSLFTREFYGNCFKALKEDGILVNQHESPYYDESAEMVRNMRRQTRKVFPLNYLYQAHIPTYPSGHWLFGFMSKRYHPLNDFQPESWLSRGLSTSYYNTKLHLGAFALPTYVIELLREVEEEY